MGLDILDSLCSLMQIIIGNNVAGLNGKAVVWRSLQYQYVKPQYDNKWKTYHVIWSRKEGSTFVSMIFITSCLRTLCGDIMLLFLENTYWFAWCIYNRFSQHGGGWRTKLLSPFIRFLQILVTCLTIYNSARDVILLELFWSLSSFPSIPPSGLPPLLGHIPYSAENHISAFERNSTRSN